MFDGVPTSKLHGDQRYLAAPIALFYWNPEPGPGYPEGRGSLQPVAIQVGQKHDAATCPIFVPGGDAAAWRLAKFWVLNAIAVQHETVAHLGACHLTIETLVVATNRQLSYEHPILALLGAALPVHARHQRGRQAQPHHSARRRGVGAVAEHRREPRDGARRAARVALRPEPAAPPVRAARRGPGPAARVPVPRRHAAAVGRDPRLRARVSRVLLRGQRRRRRRHGSCRRGSRRSRARPPPRSTGWAASRRRRTGRRGSTASTISSTWCRSSSTRPDRSTRT